VAGEALQNAALLVVLDAGVHDGRERTAMNRVWRGPILADGSVSKVGAFRTFFGASGPGGMAVDVDNRWSSRTRASAARSSSTPAARSRTS
jgi:hypothetical protein